MDKLDPKHPNVKKVNKILQTAEKAMLSGAKILGIRIDDIKEIKNADEESKPEEGSEEEESSESPEEESSEEETEEESYGPDDKKMRIKMMFGKLSPEKQNAFKEKMGDKFNSLGL